ncbi:MAG TPA: hypothetical protein VKV28_09990 [Candidatus Binataceae bacterium]|nr:hypothetical protein [Candidatus Binataceae bacterium]
MLLDPHWARVGPVFTAAFLASLVEFVEALTIVLAVGSVRGWRYALSGAGAGAVLLAAAVLAFGPALMRIPLGLIQLVVGTLLLLFGMRWLRKAVLRAADLISLRDEVAIFKRESQLLGTQPTPSMSWDYPATLTALKAVVLEGLEVAFIVVAVGGGGGMFAPACAGAGLAALIVIGLGLAVHRPLSRLPENSLKLIVGALLTTFGVFWIGEGIGIRWPGGDWSLLILLALVLVTASTAITLARQTARRLESAAARL